MDPMIGVVRLGRLVKRRQDTADYPWSQFAKYKNSTAENCKNYRKHKNYCSKLYKKERKIYYTNLNHNNITDSKKKLENCKTVLN